VGEEGGAGTDSTDILKQRTTNEDLKKHAVALKAGERGEKGR
jgi:hypothetical protein